MLIHTAGENPNAGVHNAPIQQQQNKHRAFTPKQPQKEEFNKKKRSTWIQLSFSQCEGKAPLCSKSFSQASNLRIHFVAHRGEKPFKPEREQNQPWESTYSLTVEKGPSCVHDEANHSANLEIWRLTLLLSSHSGENPHNCTQCNFGTATRKTLGFHLHTHTGENPYKCIQWNYWMKTKQALRYHLLTHSGIKPSKCKQWKYSTITKQTLQCIGRPCKHSLRWKTTQVQTHPKY